MCQGAKGARRRRDKPTMTRNEQPAALATYDDDFFTWTQEQAAALRLTRDAIGGSVDVKHIAEEIDDLGKRDLREVASYLGRLVEHLVKIDANRRSRDLQHWRDEARLSARDGNKRYSPSMRQRLDLSAIWQDGLAPARDYLADRGITYDASIECPFDLDDLLGAFDLDTALTTLASARESDSDVDA